jgi:IMP dehydrogenase
VRFDDARPHGSARVRTDVALTFDDVLLVPRHSVVHPSDVITKSRFTRGIELNVPLIAAAMDTVTESDMAIAMARAGGIGVLHKNMSVDRQAAEVDRVKRSESGMILNPIKLSPDATVREAVNLMSRFKISGLPIVDADDRLVGIITNRDLQFERSLDRPVREAMTSQGLITAPAGTTLDEAERILGEHRIEKLPVVDANGKLKGLVTVKDIHKRRQYPNANKDHHGRLRVAAAIGASKRDMDRAKALIDAGADVLVIDTAHGHSEGVLQTTALVRAAFPNVQLVVGNVASREGRSPRRAWRGRGEGGCRPGLHLYDARGDRRWRSAAHGDLRRGRRRGRNSGHRRRRHQVPGDIVKALAAGASSVMMGSMLAGTEESPGESILLEGRRFKMIRGMGSLGAMQDGSADRYFQEGEMSPKKLVPEDRGSSAVQGPGGRRVVPDGRRSAQRHGLRGLRFDRRAADVQPVRADHYRRSPRIPPARRRNHAEAPNYSRE